METSIALRSLEVAVTISVSDGMFSKQIAAALSLSVRTIEQIRANVMHKIRSGFGLKYVTPADLTHYALARLGVKNRFPGALQAGIFLSNRELQALVLGAEGYPAKIASEMLGLSIKTFQHSRERVAEKLKVGLNIPFASRAEFIHYSVGCNYSALRFQPGAPILAT